MKTLRLTKRWTPLRYHPDQLRLWQSQCRFLIVPAGRRSGKTELAKRKLVLALLETMLVPRPWADPRFFAGAPTRDQAKRIWWQDLKAMVPKTWVAGIAETDLCIRTRWGAELWVVGLDVPARIEGVGWDGCVVDELANVQANAWEANIRPALADRRGWAWLIGVPDMDSPGQVQYEKLANYAKGGNSPEWGCFTWPSADIVPPAEVESARQSMDPRTFEQEFLGKFVLAGGRAFPDFDEAVHVKPVVYDPSLPLCWTLDFNVNPFCTLIGQMRDGDFRVIHEFDIPDIRTNIMCDVFIDFCRENKWDTRNVMIFGDPTGGLRKTSDQGTTDWQIVRNALRECNFDFRVRASTRSIKDGINAVNAKLMSAAGVVHVSINQQAKRLIGDLRSALWPSDMKEQHAAAAFRYWIEREAPVRTNVQPAPIQYGVA